MNPSIVRFTLAQMRLSLPRLAAGGLAVAIGSAFVAATLLAGDVMTQTARRSVTASFADADLVIPDAVSPRQLAAVAATPGWRRRPGGCGPPVSCRGRGRSPTPRSEAGWPTRAWSRSGWSGAAGRLPARSPCPRTSRGAPAPRSARRSR